MVYQRLNSARRIVLRFLSSHAGQRVALSACQATLRPRLLCFSLAWLTMSRMVSVAALDADIYMYLEKWKGFVNLFHT